MSAAKPLPDQATLLQLLRYEPEMGFLFWRDRTAEMFSGGAHGGATAAMASWNARFSGKRTFANPDGNGYFYGEIFAVRYFTHRIIWKMVTGEDAIEVDHGNGIGTDNRFANLESVKHIKNQKNMRLHSRNTSGVMGVSWCNRTAKWHVRIGYTHLGYFSIFDEAVAARKAAEVEHGYHPNHGRAA